MGKSKLTTLYIVRHGQTDWNVAGITQGQTDVPLNKAGEKQAKELAIKLDKIHFDTAYSSDLARAHRTAEIIALEKKIAITTSKALRERHFGRFEGKKWQDNERELQKDLEKIQKLSEGEKAIYQSIDNREPEDTVISRVITFLREVAVGNAEKKVLVVSHGYVMLLLLIHLGYGTREQLPPHCIKNTAYIKLSSDGVDFYIDEVFGIYKEDND